MAPAVQPPKFTIVVVYPRAPGTRFNLHNYLHGHIPLAEKLWGPYGMTIRSITPYPDREDYHLSCVMEWPGEEAYRAANSDAVTKTIFDDVASGSYTNITPTFLTGSAVARQEPVVDAPKFTAKL